MTGTNLPHKTRKPDVIDSILLDRQAFIQMVEDFETILKKHTEKDHSLWIHVDGYEGTFESAEQVVDLLNEDDWKSRKYLSISFYRKEKDTIATWEKSLGLRLSDARILGYGMQIEFGVDIEDVQRLAIMQDVDGFIGKYKRKYYLKSGAVNAIAMTTVAVAYVWLLSNIIPADKWQEAIISAGLLLFVGLAILELITHITTLSVYDKLMPAFELVEKISETKLRRVWKFILVIGGAITFVGGVLGIVQFFR